MGNNSSACFSSNNSSACFSSNNSSKRRSQHRAPLMPTEPPPFEQEQEFNSSTGSNEPAIFKCEPKTTKFLPVIIEEADQRKKIVLVHGQGFGAWCWYKVCSWLEEAGIQPVALDLAGSGIDNTETGSIITIAGYSKPLMDYLKRLPEYEKVVLVGHGCGGAIITYAMERYPHKISKAVFVCAAMLLNGQRPVDLYAAAKDNGLGKPLTGLVFDAEQIIEQCFNQSPTEDIALAKALMRPIVLQPIMEEIRITHEKYGTVRRFFIQTLEDRMLAPEIQEKLMKENPPHKTFYIRGSDHCPFFSQPETLSKLLLDIVELW